MIKSITSVKLNGKRVLLRAGFDVPLKQTKEKEQWIVADDNRIKDVLPTLKYLIKEGARITIAAHLGRPKGEWLMEKSLWPVAQDLGRILDRKVVRIKDKLSNYPVPYIYFLESDITKNDYSILTKKLKEGDILFLENIRFYPGEEKNDPKLIDVLASYADIYVNDAFSVSHRKEVSTYGVGQRLKSYGGVSLMAEISALNKIFKNPVQPLVVIIGGAKIADKIEAINNLIQNAENVLIGGAVASAFIAAIGYEIGKSKVADIPLAKELLRNYKDKIVLPIDLVVAKSEQDHPRVVPLDKILPTDLIYDIGPKTITKFAKLINTAKTLVWNGPMGLIEVEKFAYGSKALAQTFASRSKGKAFGLVGGGETGEVIAMAKVSQFIDHISTGGGAMLEYLSGKKLPGIQVLDSK